MPVTIELSEGFRGRSHPTKGGIQKNIDAIDRAINGTPYPNDAILLVDTKSILEAIKRELPALTPIWRNT